MANRSFKKTGAARVAVFLVALLVAGAAVFAVGSVGKALPVHPIAIPVSAGDLDAERGSPVPVRVVGTDADGVEVDEMFYVDAEGKGAELAEGSYVVTVAASPIAADGTVFSVAGAMASLEVDAEGAAVLDGELVLHPLGALEADEKLVEDACEAVKDSGIDKKAATTLADAARKRRDDAVAERKRLDDAIAAAEKQGLTVLTGTIRVYDNHNAVWMDFEGKNPNDPTGKYAYLDTDPVAILFFDEGQQAVTINAGDVDGTRYMRDAERIQLSEGEWLKLDGQRVTVALEYILTPGGVDHSPFARGLQLIG